jgi:hypothetical protein
MNTELVVIWDGSHQGVDADLLCIADPPAPPPMRPIPLEELDPTKPVGLRNNRRRVDVLRDRTLILDALAHGDVVTINDLRTRTGLTGDRQLEIALGILKQKRLVRSVGYGRVRIGRRAVQGHAQ